MHLYTTPLVRGQKGLRMRWNTEDLRVMRKWLSAGYLYMGTIMYEYPEQAKTLEKALDTVQDILDIEEEDIGD